jgi:hypothetical protein
VDGDEDDGERDKVDDGIEDGDGNDDGDLGEVAHVLRDALVCVVDFLARLEHIVAGASMPSSSACGRGKRCGNSKREASGWLYSWGQRINTSCRTDTCRARVVSARTAIRETASPYSMIAVQPRALQRRIQKWRTFPKVNSKLPVAAVTGQP